MEARYTYCILLILAALLLGCTSPQSHPEVEITHSPIVATSSETVTFTASVLSDGAGASSVEILVNASVVQTCNGLSTGDTCTYTGGPYPAYEGTTVSYLANITDSEGGSDQRGYYFFAVTDANYAWSRPYMPARVSGTADDERLILLFHMAGDYASMANFVDDVEDKMYLVYGAQDIIEDPIHFDIFNFYVYAKAADASSCPGTLHADTETDISWRDVDAILHTATLSDCTNMGLHRFTAEGSNTKAFLHESGHGVFGLADEYNAAPTCYTYYFQPPSEPNIWNHEPDCRAEQTTKSRSPDACWEFTTCQTGWWGIFALNDNNVMQRGMVGDSWGIEAEERVLWFFGSY